MSDDDAWDVRVQRVLAARADSEALALRDSLASVERERLARSLAAIVATESTAARDRARAAWLLKDLCAAGAAPSLEAAYLSASATHDLRVQILDTLERCAFAGGSLALDLRRIAAATVERDETRKLLALLAALGTDDAQDLLRELARDRAARADLLAEVLARPEPWIDALLARLAAELGSDAAAADAAADADIAAAIAERAYRRLQLQLRDPAAHEPVGEALVRMLWDRRDLSLLNQLAQTGRLDGAAAAFLLGITDKDQADAALSKSQRKLLSRAQAEAARRSEGTSV